MTYLSIQCIAIICSIMARDPLFWLFAEIRILRKRIAALAKPATPTPMILSLDALVSVEDTCVPPLKPPGVFFDHMLRDDDVHFFDKAHAIDEDTSDFMLQPSKIPVCPTFRVIFDKTRLSSRLFPTTSTMSQMMTLQRQQLSLPRCSTTRMTVSTMLSVTRCLPRVWTFISRRNFMSVTSTFSVPEKRQQFMICFGRFLLS